MKYIRYYNDNNEDDSNNNDNITNNPLVMKYWVGIPRGIAMSHGQVGSLPRDGVSIKILVVVSRHHHEPQHEL